MPYSEIILKELAQKIGEVSDSKKSVWEILIDLQKVQIPNPAIRQNVVPPLKLYSVLNCFSDSNKLAVTKNAEMCNALNDTVLNDDTTTLNNLVATSVVSATEKVAISTLTTNTVPDPNWTETVSWVQWRFGILDAETVRQALLYIK